MRHIFSFGIFGSEGKKGIYFINILILHRSQLLEGARMRCVTTKHLVNTQPGIQEAPISVVLKKVLQNIAKTVLLQVYLLFFLKPSVE
jgi:hypothetical protein